MKIKYEFTDEAIEIEVAEEWGDVVIELNRKEYNVNHKETRRHTSLGGMDYEGTFFVDSTDIQVEIIRQEEFGQLYAAITKLKPEQQDLINSIFFQEMSVSDYAARQGVDHSAISHRLRAVYKKLKSFL